MSLFGGEVLLVTVSSLTARAASALLECPAVSPGPAHSGRPGDEDEAGSPSPMWSKRSPSGVGGGSQAAPALDAEVGRGTTAPYPFSLSVRGTVCQACSGRGTRCQPASEQLGR